MKNTNLQNRKNEKGITVLAIILIIVAILLVVGGVIGITTSRDKNKSNNTLETTTDIQTNITSDSANSTYIKMAKNIWAEEKQVLTALKKGDINTLKKYDMFDYFDGLEDEIEIDFASEYLKILFKDFSWREPTKNDFEDWAIKLERDIEEKSKGQGLSDDYIAIFTNDLITGKKFYKLIDKYEELYGKNDGEWNGETTSEMIERLKNVLDQIETEELTIDIEIYNFDKKGNFSLDYEDLIDDTEVEYIDSKYEYRYDFNKENWFAEFLIDEVFD